MGKVYTIKSVVSSTQLWVTGKTSYMVVWHTRYPSSASDITHLNPEDNAAANQTDMIASQYWYGGE